MKRLIWILVAMTSAPLAQASGELPLRTVDVDTKLNAIPEDAVFEIALPQEIQDWQLEHDEGSNYSRKIYFMSGDYQKRSPNGMKTYCSLNIKRVSFNRIPPKLRLKVVDSNYDTWVNRVGYVREATIDLVPLDWDSQREGVLNVQIHCNSGFNQTLWHGSLRVGNLLHAFGSALIP